MALDAFLRDPQDGRMLNRTEGHFKGFEQIDLFFQTWSVTGAHTTLVVTHGLSEHSECYARFAEGMVGHGFNVIAWDMRGHGKSAGHRGYVKDFRLFSEDLNCFMQHLKSTQHLNQPFAFVGHSMGGLVTLQLLEEHGNYGAFATCLSSPVLAVAFPVPPLKDFMARVFNHLAPQMTLSNEFTYDVLSHDRAITQSFAKDPLRHDRISPPLYLGMIATAAEMVARVKRSEVPLLMQLAGDDHLVSRPVAEAFFEAIEAPKKELIVYESFYHEIFNEIGREKVYSDMANFLKGVK
jgi:alpha-beta hydrolase superfamily lysophospholipase